MVYNAIEVYMPDSTTGGCTPSPQVIPQHSLLGGAENMKMLFDNTMALTQQALIDNQRDARRRASNDAAFDHLVSMTVAAALANATQIAEDTTATAAGAEETANAGTAVSAQAVATSLGNLASALVPIITAADGVVTAQSLAAMLATVVAAAGNAAGTSTPKP